jgi:hypothetical protein
MNLADIDIIEGNVDADSATYYEAVQHAINSGDAWKFQGSYGRTMMAAIEAGFCLLGQHPAEDAYGNPIPGRDEVQPGSKGSRAYVAEQQGEAWATRMEQVAV